MVWLVLVGEPLSLFLSREAPLRPPVLPPFADAPDVDLTLVLRAIMVKDVSDMDLHLWNEAIAQLGYDSWNG